MVFGFVSQKSLVPSKNFWLKIFGSLFDIQMKLNFFENEDHDNIISCDSVND